ncbi:MAG: glycosyltransferase family 39 protein [Anaerolineae bacterium]|nr:glycosyltransferase family 39 protein [Anaerolineae bacterium]
MKAGNNKLPVSLLVASLLLLLLAAGLRFHNLGTQSLWNDEGSSYVQATRSFSEIAANAARDIHPPGYYWALAIWRGLVGESEFALRSLSAFASLCTAAFVFAIGRRLFNPTAGLAAAFFVALNTFSLYYAQEARMYAPLALFATASIWALTKVLSTQYSARSLRSPLIRYLLALALINTAGLYTQYAYPFVMLAQGLIFLIYWLSAVSFQRSATNTRNSELGTRNLNLVPRPSVLSTQYSSLTFSPICLPSPSICRGCPPPSSRSPTGRAPDNRFPRRRPSPPSSVTSPMASPIPMCKVQAATFRWNCCCSRADSSHG